MSGFAARRRVILSPRGHLAYGQDFHTAGLREHCGLVTLTKEEGKYSWPYPAPPELLITQNPDDPNDADFIASIGNNTPIVVHLHCRWEYFNKDQKQIARKTLDNATIGVVPAAFHRREMQKIFPNIPWYTAANGIRPDLFRPATSLERKEFKLSHLLAADTKLAGFAGRLEPAKGIGVLKAICERIADQPFALFLQFPDWQAIREKEKTWARYREFVQEVRALCPRKIVVWGDTTPRFNNRPVRFFDVFLTPSLSEVQPLVVLEALASGVPVIASDSTPFYGEIGKEVSNDNFVRNWLQILPLPDLIAQGAIERESASLTEDESVELANEFIRRINDLEVYDYRQRELLSAMTFRAGFGEASMNARIATIYDEVVQRFGVKQDGLLPGELYPLTAAYIDIAPTGAGVVELFRDLEIVRITAADDPEGGIRAMLNAESDGSTIQPTHFRFEMSSNPVERQLELLTEFEKIHSKRPTA